MNRVLAAALALSVAANVFLGGFLAGRYFGAGAKPEFAGVARGAGPLGYDLHVLGPDEKTAFQDRFRANRAELRAQMHEVRNARRAFSEALAAEQWDRRRVEAALAALHAAEGSQRGAFGALVIDAFEALSAEDRRALVRAQMERRHRHWGRRPAREEGAPDAH